MAGVPYSYGGNAQSRVPYAYGGSSNQPRVPSQRDALLEAMGQYNDADQYQYPQGGQLQNVGTRTGMGSSIAGTAAGALADPALSAPIVSALGAGGRAAGQGAVQSIGGIASSAAGAGSKGVLGGLRGMTVSPGVSTGIGIGAEIIGGLLKPKGQAATASPYADITDKFKRREEGSGEGIAGGAVKWGGRGAQIGSVVPGLGTAIGAGIGALGGAIGNAFTKNAKSAYSDFSREDAVKAINENVPDQGGRLPSAQEVEQILIGQGGNGKWVGEKGLYSVLQNLDKNFAVEKASRAAQALGLPEDGAAPVTTPEAAAGMNLNPQQVRTGPDGRPIPDSGPGGMTGRANDGVYGPAGNTTVGAEPGGVTGAAPAAPTTPQVDQSKWNTDQYAKPAYTAPAASKTAPAGFNNEKWNDPNHQTPKYVVGRILSQIPALDGEHGQGGRGDRQGVPRRAAQWQRRRDDPRCRLRRHPGRRRRGRQAVALRRRRRQGWRQGWRQERWRHRCEHHRHPERKRRSARLCGRWRHRGRQRHRVDHQAARAALGQSRHQGCDHRA